ncbi:MAG: glycosyl hydrolase [Bacteroidota bacterium]
MRLFLTTLIFLLLVPSNSQAQRNRRNKVEVDTWQPVPDSLFQAMKWRNVGPFRGGRSTAVCGVIGQPDLYYMGTTGGGLWRTQDGGNTWRNISDGYFKTGSVGSVAVSASDPNVIYVGMGEAPVRGVMTSHGDGVYKSTDAGHTWQKVGLDRVRQISKVRIHPTNPDIVYVAAQGSPYAPTADRGVYRSTDGGKTWEKTLFVDERSGVSDLSMDANNPRILYAAFWDHQRLPWQVVSGGEGSSIWKSSDGGDNWEKLTKGLPDVIMGKIGVSVSPANSQRVWAIIESDKGGLYRSDNGGKNWMLINPARVLRARSWYYMHVFADPQNAETVYVLNAPVLKSIDGGKTFKPVPTPHGDNHDLWIDPLDNKRMINANDGGGNISYNGGRSWSRQSNQPTAQFYRVNADNRFPYYIYGGQQDNSTVAIPSRVNAGGIRNEDFHAVGGCESAFCAFDPDNPRYVYAGCYQGIISEYDQELETETDVMAYPYLGLGTTPSDEEVKYRFNWNAPIHVSQHDPKVIYHAGNVILRSENRGRSWEAISPDLTRNVPEHLQKGGGPITNEGAGGEVYHTLSYIAESSFDAKEIWAGADDGLLHISRDGGENWQNITPPELGEGLINCIELSTTQVGKAYVVFNRYKFNDFTPHILMTADYGATWTEIVNGIAPEAHVRVVRADSEREGLLYAGTETGLYLSYDDGAHWQAFQRNLPIVPITDLKVHQGDLIAATQGRAFWVLDDLSPVRDLDVRSIAERSAMLYDVRDASLFGGPRRDSLADRGANADFGAVIYYHLNKGDSISGPVEIQIFDDSGEQIRAFSSAEKSPAKKLDAKGGLNKLVWNLRMPSVEPIKGLVTLGGTASYRVLPGKYEARLMYGGDTLSQSFAVLEDPRMKVAQDAYDAKAALMDELYQSQAEVFATVKDMRHVKAQVQAFTGRMDTEDEAQKALKEQGEAIISSIDSLEKTMVQVQQKTFQDVINFPNQIDAKLGHILGTIDGSIPPLTAGQEMRAKDLLAEWATKKVAIEALKEEVRAFDRSVRAADIPIIDMGKED